MMWENAKNVQSQLQKRFFLQINQTFFKYFMQIE